eukprot:COSAG06_NODE_46_length_29282_cov_16.235770_4_plen_1153_part_00
MPCSRCGQVGHNIRTCGMSERPDRYGGARTGQTYSSGGSADGREIFVGPRGGRYYHNEGSSGRTYIDDHDHGSAQREREEHERRAAQRQELERAEAARQRAQQEAEQREQRAQQENFLRQREAGQREHDRIRAQREEMIRRQREAERQQEAERQEHERAEAARHRAQQEAEQRERDRLHAQQEEVQCQREAERDSRLTNQLMLDGEPLEFALGDRRDAVPELRFRGPVVATQPPLAHAELTNAEALAGAVAVAHRGGCKFIEKANHAAAAGAVALVVVNTEDELMTPGHVEELSIPVLMVRKSAGEVLASAGEVALVLESGAARKARRTALRARLKKGAHVKIAGGAVGRCESGKTVKIAEGEVGVLVKVWTGSLVILQLSDGNRVQQLSDGGGARGAYLDLLTECTAAEYEAEAERWASLRAQFKKDMHAKNAEGAVGVVVEEGGLSYCWSNVLSCYRRASTVQLRLADSSEILCKVDLLTLCSEAEVAKYETEAGLWASLRAQFKKGAHTKNAEGVVGVVMENALDKKPSEKGLDLYLSCTASARPPHGFQLRSDAVTLRLADGTYNEARLEVLTECTAVECKQYTAEAERWASLRAQFKKGAHAKNTEGAVGVVVSNGTSDGYPERVHYPHLDTYGCYHPASTVQLRLVDCSEIECKVNVLTLCSEAEVAKYQSDAASNAAKKQAVCRKIFDLFDADQDGVLNKMECISFLGTFPRAFLRDEDADPHADADVDEDAEEKWTRIREQFVTRLGLVVWQDIGNDIEGFIAYYSGNNYDCGDPEAGWGAQDFIAWVCEYFEFIGSLLNSCGNLPRFYGAHPVQEAFKEKLHGLNELEALELGWKDMSTRQRKAQEELQAMGNGEESEVLRRAVKCTKDFAHDQSAVKAAIERADRLDTVAKIMKVAERSAEDLHEQELEPLCETIAALREALKVCGEFERYGSEEDLQHQLGMAENRRERLEEQEEAARKKEEAERIEAERIKDELENQADEEAAVAYKAEAWRRNRKGDGDDPSVHGLTVKLEHLREILRGESDRDVLRHVDRQIVAVNQLLNSSERPEDAREVDATKASEREEKVDETFREPTEEEKGITGISGQSLVARRVSVEGYGPGTVVAFNKQLLFGASSHEMCASTKPFVKSFGSDATRVAQQV